jgi:hypothetical protein
LEAIKVINEFDNYLRSAFSVDYWSDEGIGIAAEKAIQFTSNDWEQLKLITGNRDAVWLVRCAEVLGDIESVASIEILLELMKHNNIEVQISALDSMSALLDNMDIRDSSIIELRKTLDQFSAPSDVVQKMLDSLKTKVA